MIPGWTVTLKPSGNWVAVIPDAPISYEGSDPCRGFNLYAGDGRRDEAIEAGWALASYVVSQGRPLSLEEARAFWPELRGIKSEEELQRLVHEAVKEMGCDIPLDQIAIIKKPAGDA